MNTRIIIIAALATISLGTVGTLAVTGGARSEPETSTVDVRPSQAYTPRSVNGADDDYHCFLIDPKLDRNVYVTGAEVTPQATDIVHHVILFKFSGDSASRARTKDAESGGRGWGCFGGPDVRSGGGDSGRAAEQANRALSQAPWLTAWTPGKTTNALPPGTGIPLPKGSVLVMQVHYNLTKPARPDRSQVELTISPESAELKALATSLLPAPVELPCPSTSAGAACDRDTALASAASRYGRRAAAIPNGLLLLCGRSPADLPDDVGDASAIDTSCTRSVDQPMTIYGVAGHMHTRGSDIRLSLVQGGRTQTLLHIPKWDFHWQDSYYLEEPIQVEAGAKLQVSCRFDNSGKHQGDHDASAGPPRYVTWGEGTGDEMCLGIVQAHVPGDAGDAWISQAREP